MLKCYDQALKSLTNELLAFFTWTHSSGDKITQKLLRCNKLTSSLDVDTTNRGGLVYVYQIYFIFLEYTVRLWGGYTSRKQNF